MRLGSGWWWKALILPGCIAYQLLVHSVTVDEYGSSVRLTLAAVPLLGFAYWVARFARYKLRWALALLAAGAVIYGIDQQDRLGLAAANGFTHAAINLFLMWLFGRTLFRGREALITGFARRVHGALPPEIETYSRRVTLAWCVFFVVQVGLSAVLFAFATLEAWSLFVNVLSVPLVAFMFVAEYLYRVTRYRDFAHASLAKGMELFADKTARAPDVR
jgi:uncharacterized membrane protein